MIRSLTSVPHFGVFGILALLCLAAAPAERDYIWWEAESPIATNIPRTHRPFAPSSFADRASQLSGGDWLDASGPRQGDELFATYKPTVSSAGRYELWARKFWSHGPFKWRFDAQPWQTCDSNVPLADDQPLKKFVNVDWVFLGDVELAAGDHPFEVRLLAPKGQDTTAAFDCFCLSRSTFMPDGRHKPDDRPGEADPGRFAWNPSVDRFTTDAVLDLRSMNEPTAGEHGPVRRDGDHFVLGSGTPMRFWGVGVNPAAAAISHRSVDYLARSLAKRGVNLVRFHGPLYDAANPRKLDPKKLDDLQYLVHAMARQGIYTAISFYFPLWCDGPKLGLAGFDSLGNKHPYGLVYFDSAMQAIYRDWQKQLMATPSPYSKQPLVNDSAVVFVECVNEDSLLFWTLTKKNIPAADWTELEDQFTVWLIKQYGSLKSAADRWDGQSMSQDSVTHAGLQEAWGMTPAGVKRFGAIRMGDQVHFLAATQRQFYEQSAGYLHSLGYGGMVNAGNWMTADDRTLGPIERWTYAGVDMTDQHGYYGPDVTANGSTMIGAGEAFKSIPSVLRPDHFPLRLQRNAGQPSIISELDWQNPNRYRSDAVFLTAAYGSLQGCDGLCWFFVDNNWLRESAMNVYGVATPTIAGAFPAAAMVYRNGWIPTPPPAVVRAFASADLFDLATPRNPVDALAPLTGPTVRSFDDSHAADSDSATLAVDLPHRTLSRLPDVMWNYAAGVVRVNEPMAQGATGLLEQSGPVQLDDVTIDCKNEFAAVWVVPMDGQPIKTSRKLLVQVTTDAQPLHFVTRPTAKGAEEIVSPGEPPFGVSAIAVHLTFAGRHGLRVQTLDENGYPRGALERAATNTVELNTAAIEQVIMIDP